MDKFVFVLSYIGWMMLSVGYSSIVYPSSHILHVYAPTAEQCRYIVLYPCLYIYLSINPKFLCTDFLCQALIDFDQNFDHKSYICLEIECDY